MTNEFKRYKAALAFEGLSVQNHARRLKKTRRAIYYALSTNECPALRRKILRFTERVLSGPKTKRVAT